MNQASEFENMSRFIINYIQKTFDKWHNIAMVLTQLNEIDTSGWKPEMKHSVATYPNKNQNKHNSV